MGIMTAYSAALIVSCFFMAWGAVLLTRPFLTMLWRNEEETYSNAIIIAWIALGFLQVVGMPFAWWAASVAVSIIAVLMRKSAVVRHGWQMLIAGGIGCVVLVIGCQAPSHLITESCIIIAASFAGFLVSRGRHGLLCDPAAAISLAMCLAYVAYSAASPAIIASLFTKGV